MPFNDHWSVCLVSTAPVCFNLGNFLRALDLLVRTLSHWASLNFVFQWFLRAIENADETQQNEKYARTQRKISAESKTALVLVCWVFKDGSYVYMNIFCIEANQIA